MSDTQVVGIITDALSMAAKLGGPVLVSAVAIGVFVSLIQTVTQIQEQTLTFVPKLVGLGVIVLVGGRWMISELTEWVTELWSSIPDMV